MWLSKFPGLQPGERGGPKVQVHLWPAALTAPTFQQTEAGGWGEPHWAGHGWVLVSSATSALGWPCSLLVGSKQERPCMALGPEPSATVKEPGKLRVSWSCCGDSIKGWGGDFCLNAQSPRALGMEGGFKIAHHFF